MAVEETQHFCAPAHSAPLVQCDAPERTEDDDTGHVERPTGEAILLAHLRLAHGVKEELQIPGESRDSRQNVVAQDRRPGCSSCRYLPVLSKRLVVEVKRSAPDEVGRESPGQHHDKHRQALPDCSRPVLEGE